MNTRLIAQLLAVVLATAAMAHAADPAPHDPNPTKDPDVQRGYDRHQQEYRDKQKNESSHQGGNNQGGNNQGGNSQGGNGNYDVNKSKDTAKGTSPRPGN